MRIIRFAVAASAVILLTVSTIHGAIPARAGGASPEEALKLLQRAAAARDITGMTAMLDPESRALFLRDLLMMAAMLYTGGVDGLTTDDKHGVALTKTAQETVHPAMEAFPIDPALLEGHDEGAQTLILMGWAISKMPVGDSLRLAEATANAVRAVDHPSVKQLLDAYVAQVPTEALRIDRQTDTGVWAVSGDRPIGFTKLDGRWFASGVWFEKKKITLSAKKSPSAGVSPNVIIGGRPAALAAPEVAPAGIEGKPATALEAYTLFRGVLAVTHPGARLRELQTGVYGLSPQGGSAAWFGQFVTSTPGEVVTLAYLGGEVLAPSVSSIPAAAALPAEEKITFDTARLAQNVRDAAAAASLTSGAKMTAALVQNAATAEPQWIFHNFGEDDRISWSVFLDAKSAAVTKVAPSRR